MFSTDVRAAYVEALRDPSHAHAICEEYRAAATIDREHDRASRASGQRIECPVLVLWSAEGALDTWYAAESGPVALWRAWGDDVQGRAVRGGHFFPEEAPDQTADALSRFFGSRAPSSAAPDRLSGRAAASGRITPVASHSPGALSPGAHGIPGRCQRVVGAVVTLGVVRTDSSTDAAASITR